MQTFKVILGVLIAISAIWTVVEEFAVAASGTHMLGSFLGLLLMLGLAYWLINSGLKGLKKK